VNVLDAGCGVGVLTKELSLIFSEVVGVDPSAVSIELARAKYGACAVFVAKTIEKYAKDCQDQFDLVVASMVLMDVLCVQEFVQSVKRVLRPGGVFIFSLTHPCYWPSYYGYVNEPWFRYGDEIIIEAPFKISGDSSCSLSSTHVHRPLSFYVAHLGCASLYLEVIVEPMPTAETEILYPCPWKYPRYLLGRCKLEK
jgi:predicted TPR repeat methyltransferase